MIKISSITSPDVRRVLYQGGVGQAERYGERARGEKVTAQEEMRRSESPPSHHDDTTHQPRRRSSRTQRINIRISFRVISGDRCRVADHPSEGLPLSRAGPLGPTAPPGTSASGGAGGAAAGGGGGTRPPLAKTHARRLVPEPEAERSIRRGQRCDDV
ncbi:unnamed protein product [Boreogadus saida]